MKQFWILSIQLRVKRLSLKYRKISYIYNIFRVRDRNKGVIMRKALKAVSVLVLLLTASSIAQNMCVELCTPCVGKKKDQTCKKVEEHCHCVALLDSISKAQTAKEAELSDSQNKLSQELQNICTQEFCTSKISFENGIFKEISLDNNPTAQEAAKSIYETKVSYDKQSMARIEPLPPMNGECSAFCGDCPVTDKMLKSKKPKYKDKFCKKIEESCKCIDYAINAKQLEEQAKADSVAEFESKVKRIENAALLAKQLHVQCDNNEKCILSVSIANKEMEALSVQKIKEPIKVEKKQTTEPVEEKPVASIAEEKTIEETPTSQEQPATYTIGTQSFGANIHEVDPSETSSSYKAPNAPKEKSSYFGFSLAFDFPESDDFYGIYFEGAPKSYDFGINLGFLFRTYFNKAVSFNLGFNAIYRLATYDGAIFYIDFSTLMAEIPLGFRFGIPLGSLPISPFISTSIHIRKPIYHSIYIETDHYGYSYNWYTKDSKDGAASIDEWEFIPLLGVGLELSRHFSFEFQWYIGSFCTHDGGFHEAYETGDSWRLKFEAAF